MEWMQGNWGNLASAISLILTVFVLVAATKAKKAAIEAAKEAKSATLKRTLADDLAGCTGAIATISSFSSAQRWEVAAFVSQKLMSDLELIASRWHGLLKEGDQNDILRQASVQMPDLRRQLNRFAAAKGRTSMENREKVDEAIVRITRLLNQLRGDYQYRSGLDA
jgi:hypothetical protein